MTCINRKWVTGGREGARSGIVGIPKGSAASPCPSAAPLPLPALGDPAGPLTA